MPNRWEKAAFRWSAPGNDVDAVTGTVAAGCNVGDLLNRVGYPTGTLSFRFSKFQPTPRSQKMPDIIDYDCGPLSKARPLANIADSCLKIIATASGTGGTKNRMRARTV